jgi:hypothetical protein
MAAPAFRKSGDVVSGPERIPEELPAILKEIAEAIGMAAMLKLVAERGGVRVHVPKRPETSRGDLVAIVGVPAARDLAKLYGGEAIEIPRAVCLHSKKQAIAHAEGSTRQIALCHGVTERYVRKVRKISSCEIEMRQHKLFS